MAMADGVQALTRSATLATLSQGERERVEARSVPLSLWERVASIGEPGEGWHWPMTARPLRKLVGCGGVEPPGARPSVLRRRFYRPARGTHPMVSAW